MYNPITKSNNIIENNNKYSLLYGRDLKRRNIFDNNIKYKQNNNVIVEKDTTNKKNEKYKFHKNSFFWIIYTIIYGYTDYELLSSKEYFSKEQEIRYALIDTLQKLSSKKKDFLKGQQIKIPNIITELGNNIRLSNTSFIGLCIILNINVCLIRNTVAQLILQNDDKMLYCIDINNTDLYKEKVSKEYCDKKYYLVENIGKPFYSISSYKADELRDICKSNGIETVNINGKNKTKKILYQELNDKIEI